MKYVNIASPVIDGKQTLVVLSADGRLFRLDKDPRDFNTGVPGHRVQMIWNEIEGPKDPAQGETGRGSGAGRPVLPGSASGADEVGEDSSPEPTY